MALDIPDPTVLDALVAMQAQLADTGADLRLVERQNLHFTVRFLGDITEAQAAEAGSRLRDLRLSGAEVEVKGVGAFPNVLRPSVLWVGVAPEHEGLVAPIAQSVIGVLQGIGQRDDRPFIPHATLARAKPGRNSQALTEVLRTSSERSFGTIRFSAIKLKSSTLTPRGPLYSDVGEYALA